MQMELDRASETDKEQLRSLHHAAYQDLVERVFGPWQEARQDRYFEEDWSEGPVDKIFVDGQLAGYCSVENTDGYIHVRELVIDPQFQGRGVGSAVLKQLMDDARDQCIPVRLATHRANKAAALYERLGFVETGQNETHRLYEWIPGRQLEP